MDNVLTGNYKPFECCVFAFFFPLNALFILSLEGNGVGLQHHSAGSTRLGLLNDLEVRIVVKSVTKWVALW